MSDTEKELIKLGERHISLVKHLKESLLLGQLGFIKAAKFLHEIKESQSYLGEDLSHPWTWQDFVARPDLPIPGRTPESRRRTADALIRVFKIFRLDNKIANKQLGEIGWTKLDLIAPICEEEKEAEVIEDWIVRARELTVPNLMAEIKGDGKDSYDSISCKHPDAYKEWRCPHCGARTKRGFGKHE